jgi:hypothetical protein
MKVYVAVRGEYDDRVVAGVYESLEVAQTRSPGSEWHESDGEWNNGLEDNDCVWIAEYEVEDSTGKVLRPGKMLS